MLLQNKRLLEKLDNKTINDQVKLKIGSDVKDAKSENLYALPAALYTTRMRPNKRIELENLKGLKLSTSSSIGKSSIKDKQLKCRLLYEWKNVFRALTLFDINQTGWVTKEQFAKTISRCKVFLSREDYKKIHECYSVDSGIYAGKINYHKITDDIGANNNTVKLIQRSKKYLSQIKLLRTSSEQRLMNKNVSFRNTNKFV